MVQRNLIDINPNILRWAREESGYDKDEIADRLGLNTNVYEKWETSGSQVPFNVLKEISKEFSRQIAVFFLTEVPQKSKKPKDHRNLNLVTAENSKETLLSIRRANWYISLLKELNGNKYYEKKYSWLREFHDKFGKKNLNNDIIAAWIRNKIGITAAQQVSVSTQNHIYKLWREGIEEKLGIPIFQFKMPLDEIQGFSLIEDYPFCIVVNNLNALTSRIFTLFHELGHILKKQSGLCYPEKIEKSQTFEFECNSFAGKLLIPTEIIVQTESADEIYKHAKSLKVSSEAYLRRLFELKYISGDKFYRLLSEIRSRVITDKLFIPHSTILQRSQNSRGIHLFDTVIDAARNNKISFGLAADVLGVKLNYLLNL
jgi:Zn-dependent peptidase ImmA (M78 family)/transcriptional regulator with XRE-family HTH domain